MCLHKVLKTKDLPRYITGYKIVRKSPVIDEYYGMIYQKPMYKLGYTVTSDNDKLIRSWNTAETYDSGFHAYKSIRALMYNVSLYFGSSLYLYAQINGFRVIKVRLYDLTAKGKEDGYVVYVGKRMEILEDVTTDIINRESLK